ncbi:hypothetical protein FHS31_002524 [Sphingomonas vulcanisoli]|uniref:Uncharacterized protein n=1 Tax=Sphingomonas vulcanisoli TaxID=1658060 RepID=A0ABX0TWT1_9SPHN|nr:hypothetical protein [Sphingomonas vulcanisoli]NIJ08900.1 hypothetical protein [Sphingomonas vulcanisoli]
MQKSAKALIAGLAGLACAGGVYAAAQNVHVLKVALPDGSIAQIHYVGDVAPKVVVAPSPVALADDDFGAPFAMLDRVAAEMDRQQQAMLQQVAAMQAHAASGAAVQTAGGTAPQGVYHYSYVASSGGPSGCTQSYELTSYGDKQAPKEVSRQSGDCRGVAPLVKTAAPATPTPPKAIPAAVAKPAPARVSPDSI